MDPDFYAAIAVLAYCQKFEYIPEFLSVFYIRNRDVGYALSVNFGIGYFCVERKAPSF